MTHKLYHSWPHISFHKIQKNKLHIRHSCKVAWDDPRNEHLGIGIVASSPAQVDASLPALASSRYPEACALKNRICMEWLEAYRRKVRSTLACLSPSPLGNKDMTQLYVVCKRPPPSTSAVTVWRGRERKGRRSHRTDMNHITVWNKSHSASIAIPCHCLEHSRRLWLRARCVAGLEMLWIEIPDSFVEISTIMGL